MANTQAIAYAQQIADALNAKFPKVNEWDRTYGVDHRGQKYIRVTSQTLGIHESVHLFVDSEGNVYKSAGWKAPAKGIRYNVSTEHGMAEFQHNADRFGSYLYAGAKRPLPGLV